MSSIGDFQLPGGWKLLSLDCLGKAITGNTPPTKNPENYGGDIPFIKPTELVNRPVSMARETISAIGAEKSRILPKGGVLVSCIGNLGKTGIAKRDVAFNQQINAVVFNEIVVPEYGFYYFQTSKFRHDLESLASATTISIVNKSKFESIKVPIAPIEQQKRIVTKIEELFTHIDAGIASLQAAKKLLKQYRQSVLKAAVTGELIGEKYSEDVFKSIEFGLESLGQGWSPRCEKNPSPDETAWAVIKTTAVQSLEYRQEENKRLPLALVPRPKHEVLVGDLLVTRAGPRVRVGISCLVKETRPRLMLCDKVYRLRVNKEVIFPEYLELILNSPTVLDEIETIKSGINDSGVNLTQDKFIKLKIPYPKIKDQSKIVLIANGKLEAIARLDKELENQLLKAGKNKQSILTSAFTGVL